MPLQKVGQFCRVKDGSREISRFMAVKFSPTDENFSFWQSGAVVVVAFARTRHGSVEWNHPD